MIAELQKGGLAVLLPSTPEEAKQMLKLHGASIDLAVIHREEATGQSGERGLKFVGRMREDPMQKDLPFIVTSHVWGDAEFARHQDSPQGANAYLRWPFEAKALLGLVEAIFGEPPSASVSIATHATGSMGSVEIPSARTNRTQSTPSPPKIDPKSRDIAGGGSVVLEDPTTFSGVERSDKSNSSIQLEAPSSEVPSNEVEAPESLTMTGFTIEPPADATRVELSDVSRVELKDPASVLPQNESTRIEKLGTSAELPVFQEKHRASAVEAYTAPEPHAGPSVPDTEALQEMPYLYGRSRSAGMDPSVAFAQPSGDAVVPGGAAQSPDIDTLKKYLLLREQDVAVLSTQLRATQEQVKKVESELRASKGAVAELTHVSSEQRKKLEEFDREKAMQVESLQGEVSELRFQLKARIDKARLLEAQMRETGDEMERLKERVRVDIRKIRVREKELENRLEIVKKDSEALISARETKIIELKRKLDLIEFNMDLLQDKFSREKQVSGKLKDRLSKAAQVVRVAGGLLDTPGGAAQLAAALSTDDKEAV